MGYHSDENNNKDKFEKLLRFHHLHNYDELISFDEYVDKMKEDQKFIYYLTGINKEIVLNSVYLESVKQKNYDVLLLTEPIDEFISSKFDKFKEKKFCSLSKDGSNVTDENETKKLEEENKSFLDFVKETLKDKIESVKINNLLNDIPCLLTTSQFGWSANLERILKAQAIRDTNMDMFMKARKILEINLNNPLVKKLSESFDNNEKSKKILCCLYNCALINGGFDIENPKELTSNFIDLLNV